MRLLTLNIWGAPYAKHRAPRIRAMTIQLEILSPDILAFQEVYLPSDRQLMISLLKDTWPHYHYFESGWLGSGLLTMSKYPIVETQFLRFRLGGKQEDIQHGDYYVGKGIGLAQIATPNGYLNVYNCHTHAQYDLENDNEYSVYNESNLYEAAQFISNTVKDFPTILCGDLNTRPDQMGYEIIKQLGTLTDAYHQHHGTHPITFSHNNPYTAEFDQTLDYVLTQRVKVENIHLVMTEELGSHSKILAFSDHYGLMANFSLMKSDSRVLSDATLQQAVLLHLQNELAALQAELEGERVNRLALALIGLTSLFDFRSVTILFKRFPKLQRFLQFAILAGSLGFSFYQLGLATLILRERRQAVQELLDEIDTEMVFLNALVGSN